MRNRNMRNHTKHETKVVLVLVLVLVLVIFIIILKDQCKLVHTVGCLQSSPYAGFFILSSCHTKELLIIYVPGISYSDISRTNSKLFSLNYFLLPQSTCPLFSGSTLTLVLHSTPLRYPSFHAPMFRSHVLLRRSW